MDALCFRLCLSQSAVSIVRMSERGHQGTLRLRTLTASFRRCAAHPRCAPVQAGQGRRAQRALTRLGWHPTIETRFCVTIKVTKTVPKPLGNLPARAQLEIMRLPEHPLHPSGTSPALRREDRHTLARCELDRVRRRFGTVLVTFLVTQNLVSIMMCLNKAIKVRFA